MTNGNAKKEAKITIDGVDYSLNELSSEAKTQVANLQYVEREIANIQANLAVFQTARQRYVEELKKHLPEK